MSNHYQNYLEKLEKLYVLNTSKMMKLGLEQPRALHKALGSPADQLNIVHVAGTNGKGSVCFKVAASLQDAGYSVGLFSSPHISTYRERIRVNGEMISEQNVAEGLSKIFTTGVSATFFEVTTLLALDYFAKEKVDWVVLETGLGGRLDATNIVTPKVSVITTIGFDHCQFLGNTIEDITKEKAGIIKSGVPVVVGPKVPVEFLKVENLHPVKGPFNHFEEENQAIVTKVLEVLDVPVGEGVTLVPSCRFEKLVANDQEYILDVAHNPQGIKSLFERLSLDNPTVICGMSEGKDLQSSLLTILEFTNNLSLVSGSHPRIASLEEMLETIPDQRINTYNTVTDAIRSLESTQEPIIICGSFFIMEEARRALGIYEPTDAMSLHECLQSSKAL
jgi:dihydrofolate synthase / folylpolyglutamate synthase